MPDVFFTLGAVLGCVALVLVGVVVLAGMVALAWQAIHHWLLLPLACRRVVRGLVYLHQGYGLVRVAKVRSYFTDNGYKHEVMAALAGHESEVFGVGDPVDFLRHARPASGAEQLGVSRA